MRKLVFLIIALVALAIFTLFYVLPWIAEKAAALIPVSTEVQIGESLAQVYTQGSEKNDSATYYVKQFVQELDLDDTYKIDAQVIESEDINAFALPGGKIFIYSAILEKMNSYKELVALMGHEVTHVVNRHALKSICRSAATGLVISGLFGDVSGITAGILAQADQFKQLNYSRELETEADNNGVNVMVQNKVQPEGMLSLLKLLKAEEIEMPQFMKYLSTHPDTDSRISNISKNPAAKTVFPENEKLKAIFEKIKRCI